MHVGEKVVPPHAPLDLTQVLERITDAFLALDADWRVIWLNRKTETLTNSSREEMMGRVYWELYPKALGTRIEFEYRRAMADQRPTHFTVLSPTLGVWLDISAYPAPDGMTLYFRDVSERVEAEREEARGREQQRAATELGQRALAGCGIGELRQETVRALMRTLRIDAAEIRECVKGDRRLRFVAGTHWLGAPIGREWVPLQSFPGYALQSAASVVSVDLHTEARFGDRSLSEGGVWSGVCVPIMHLEAPLGVLAVYCREPRAFSESEVRFVETLAVTLAETSALLATQDALRDSNREVTEILESITDGFVALDVTLHITHVNHHFVNWSGRKKEALIGQPFDVIFSELHLPEIEDRLLTAHHERHPVYVEYFYEPRGRWYEARAFPWRDGLSIYFRDITRRKRTEAEIRALNEELEHRVAARTEQLEYANKELEAFSYSVSHDLRAPLRAIDGFSQALEEDYGAKLDEAGRGYLQRVRGAAQRMADLIDALLQLARVARAPINAKPVDLCELAHQVFDELRSSDPDREVTVSIEGPAVVLGERSLLMAAMANLIGNAWKFTRNEPHAHIEFRPHGDLPDTYVVRDNGAGFDMTYGSKLFSAFARLHAAEEFEGTGIGLATVARIIHRHGGRIWAEGKPGQGAAFYFTLASSGGS